MVQIVTGVKSDGSTGLSGWAGETGQTRPNVKPIGLLQVVQGLQPAAVKQRWSLVN